ncbi:MAG: pentapeptide repeat-containing protein [Planctomycetaceae bacterium]|nr:pentapeptide repeat-containing protein [Planctomycetaceae bacterium]
MTESVVDDSLQMLATPSRADAAEYPSLSAEMALERLKAGQKLERVRISRLKFEGDFPKGIELVHVELDRPEFRKATFHGPVVFSRCEVIGLSVHRTPVVFEQSLAFKSCTLRRPRLDGVEIRGALTLDNSEIYGPLKIHHATLGSTHAWETKFRGWAEFKHCTIAGIADFRSCHVEEGLVLNCSTFKGDLLFRGMTCAKKLDLTDTTCEGLIDLSKAKLHDYAYLEGVHCGPLTRFAFLNAVADRMQIRPEQVSGRLMSEAEHRYGDARHEYGLLKASYQIQHRFDDEDWALHQFKINQRRGKPRSWARPWSKLAQLCDLVFLDWGCGYGTKPNRAVTTAIILMALFALIYAAGIHQFEISSPPLDHLPKDHWQNRLLFGLLTTVSVFTAGFGGDQLQQAHGWILLPLACEAVLGTLLWGLFVVAFSRKVIR